MRKKKTKPKGKKENWKNEKEIQGDQGEVRPPKLPAKLPQFAAPSTPPLPNLT